MIITGLNPKAKRKPSDNSRLYFTEYCKRKGFETFIRTAKLLPHIQFILIGKPLDSTIETLKKMHL